MKNFWLNCNRIFRENIILFLGIFFLGYWFLFSGEIPIVYRNAMFTKTNHQIAAAPAMEMADSSNFSVRGAMNKSAGAENYFLPPVFADDFDPEEKDKKIIKNASLTLEVENTEDSKKMVEEEIQKLKGSITNLDSWEVRPEVLAYRFTIRIPTEKLDIAIENLNKLGVKKSENFSIRDITAQYTDTENRLKNSRIYLDSLRELMKKESKELKDILETKKEIASAQEKIENLEKLQKRRDTDVAYSTLNLTINPKVEIGDLINPDWHPKKSWKMAVNDLLQSSRTIFDKFVKLIVFTPIWLPVFLFLFILKKHFCKKCKK